MGLIKRADIEDYTRNAYVMDINDLEQRGKATIDAANSQAQSILDMANAKRKQLVESAEKDGYDKGQGDGYEQGYIDGVVNGVEDARKDRSEVLDQLTQMWTVQLDAFENQRDEMLEQARTQIVELGAMIAQRVIRRSIELEPAIVLDQMEAVLSSVTESTRLVLAVHPDDIEIAQTELSKLIERFSTCEHAQVVTDPSLSRGSCVGWTSTGGMIDASIETQLERIVDALLPMGQDRVDEGMEMNAGNTASNPNPSIQDQSQPSQSQPNQSQTDDQPQDDAA
ncbi:MAG: hypothetical protein JKX70_00975 [Phycisphaerales bacterium]|nr:hypothetical protein [Phycisphaerales bacterium]